MANAVALIIAPRSGTGKGSRRLPPSYCRTGAPGGGQDGDRVADAPRSPLGPAEAFRRLRETPEAFGRLQGREILAQPTRARAEALDVARRLGSQGLERQSQLAELREALATAARHGAKGRELSGERRALASTRSELLDDLRRQVAGLDLDQLDGRLSPRQLETLRALEQADELHLAPLRKAIDAFRAAKSAGRSRRTVLRLASNLSALYHATPRNLLRRLAPPQVRLILGATSLAAAAVKKLSAETKDQDRARRIVLGP